MDRMLPAFCHISDYGVAGFQNLHLMIAASSPLVVWAPSGIELNERYARGECALNARMFLELVHLGHIQVVGREWWLTSPAQRNGQARPEARWFPDFDDALLAMWNSASSDVAQRQAPVRIMPSEAGYAYADAQIGEPGRRIRNVPLYRRVLALYDQHRVPIGTAEKAERSAEQITHRNAKHEAELRRRTIVREILRDARNHVDAVRMSDSDVPFWSLSDGQFIGLLEGGDEDFVQEQQDVHPDSKAYFNDYLHQAMDLLARIGRAASTPSSRLDQPAELLRFLQSDAHQGLVEWLHLHVKRSRHVDMTDQEMARLIYQKFREDLENLESNKRRLALLQRRPVDQTKRVIESLSVLAGLLPILANETEWGLPAIVFLLCSVINNDVIPEEFDGFRWPFLYALGERPMAWQLQEVHEVLTRIAESI